MVKSVSEYFNKEIKEQFINSLPENNSKLIISRFLKRFGNYVEKYYQKDLYNMSASEIKEGYVSLGVFDYGQIRSEISHMKKYIYWAQSSNFAKQTGNSIENISPYDISIKNPLRKNLYKDIDDMIDKIKVVYPESEWDNCYYVPSVICLSWLGFTIKEMLLLKNEDIDIDNKRIIFDNKIRVDNIDDRIITILNKYKSNSIGQRTCGTATCDIYLKDLGYFLKREIKGNLGNTVEPLQHSAINSKLSVNFTLKYKQIMGEENIVYSFKNENIILAGKLNALYQMEQQGIILDDDALLEHLGTAYNSESRVIKLEDEKQRYQAYKEVFWS